MLVREIKVQFVVLSLLRFIISKEFDNFVGVYIVYRRSNELELIILDYLCASDTAAAGVDHGVILLPNHIRNILESRVKIVR